MTFALPALGSSLVLALVLAGASPRVQETEADVKQAFDVIQKEFDLEFKEVRAATKDLPQAEATLIFEDFFANVLPDFSARYAVLAREHEGTPVAFDAWSRVVSLGSLSDTRSERGTTLLKEALGALTTDHIQSEALAGFARNLRYSTQAVGEDLTIATLEGLAARTPHRAVKASALYALAAVLGDQRADGDPRLAQARVLLADLRQNYGDVAYNDEGSYAEAAASFLFALENLAVGKPCPDFSALDVEGAAFKLSDYEGKVVLLDFWGFW